MSPSVQAQPLPGYALSVSWQAAMDAVLAFSPSADKRTRTASIMVAVQAIEDFANAPAPVRPTPPYTQGLADLNDAFNALVGIPQSDPAFLHAVHCARLITALLHTNSKPFLCAALPVLDPVLTASIPYAERLFCEVRTANSPTGAILTALCGGADNAARVFADIFGIYSDASHKGTFHPRVLHALALHLESGAPSPLDPRRATLLARKRMHAIGAFSGTGRLPPIVAIDALIARLVAPEAWRQAIQQADHGVQEMAVLYAIAGPAITIQAMIDCHPHFSDCPYSAVHSLHTGLAMIKSHFPDRALMAGLRPWEQRTVLGTTLYPGRDPHGFA